MFYELILPQFLDNKIIVNPTFNGVEYHEIRYREPIDFSGEYTVTMKSNATINAFINKKYATKAIRKFHGLDENNTKIVKRQLKTAPFYIDFLNTGMHLLYLNNPGMKRVLNTKNNSNANIRIFPNEKGLVIDSSKYDHRDNIETFLQSGEFDNIELYWINNIESPLNRNQSSHMIILCKDSSGNRTYGFRYEPEVIMDQHGRVRNKNIKYLSPSFIEQVGNGWSGDSNQFWISIPKNSDQFTFTVKNYNNKVYPYAKVSSIFNESNYELFTSFNDNETTVKSLRVNASDYHTAFEMKPFQTNSQVVKFDDMFTHDCKTMGKNAEEVYASHIYIKQQDSQAFKIEGNADYSVQYDPRFNLHYNVYTFDNPKDIFDAKIKILDRKKFDNLPRVQIYAAVNLKAEKDFGVIHNLGAFAHDIKSVFK